MTFEDFIPEDRNPFLESQLDFLFEIHPNNASQLLGKESNNIEYKQTFHFESFDTHARTFAAFANTNGGYFVFGVDDKTRELVGLQDDRFDRLEPSIPTTFLNKKFAPEIRWRSHLYSYDDKTFGLIYVYPSKNKPIIAQENGERIIEGQIFYRYNGVTETIRYAEIRQIMDDIRRTEQELWLRHIRRLADIGVDNAAVFSFDDGTAHAKSGAFIIDAELLSQIQFLREGEFEERIGAPAIKIVGEAEVLAAGTISPSSSRLSAKALTPIDIYEVFLRRQTPQSPPEYIRAICSFSSFYYPVYYFAYLAQFTMDELLNFILAQPYHGAKSLVERIRDDPSHNRYYQLAKTESAAEKRTLYTDLIQNKDFDLEDDYDPQMLFQGLQLLKREDIDLDYLFPILHGIFKSNWEVKGSAKTNLRKAISHIDYLVFAQMIPQEEQAD